MAYKLAVLRNLFALAYIACPRYLTTNQALDALVMKEEDMNSSANQILYHCSLATA